MTFPSDCPNNALCATDKPRQGDLFTGEFTVKPPKRGNGRHVKLAHDTGEPVKATGMAHFPGTGPKRTYCHQCAHCQDIDVYRGGRYRPPPNPPGRANISQIRTKRGACLKAAQFFDGIVQRAGIGANKSCKYFEKKSVPTPQEAMAAAEPDDSASETPRHDVAAVKCCSHETFANDPKPNSIQPMTEQHEGE